MASELPDQWSTQQMKPKYYENVFKLSKSRPPKKIMKSQWVNTMIERIQSAKIFIAGDEGNNLQGPVKEAIDNYEVSYLKSQKKYILLQKSPKPKPSRVIFPLEKSFEVILKAHLETQHGGQKAMQKWLTNSDYVVANICTQALLSVCQKCTGNYTTVTPNSPTHAIINMLDLSSDPDNSFQYLLVYIDSKTTFLQLRPLSAENLIDEISMEVLKLFSDFEAPQCVVVQNNWKETFEVVLKRMDEVFGTISLETDENDHQISAVVEEKITEWMSQGCDKWSVGSQFVQWEMNRKRHADGSPYEKFFKLGPKFYENHGGVGPDASVKDDASKDDASVNDDPLNDDALKDDASVKEVITVLDDEIDSEGLSEASYNPKPSKMSRSKTLNPKQSGSKKVSDPIHTSEMTATNSVPKIPKTIDSSKVSDSGDNLQLTELLTADFDPNRLIADTYSSKNPDLSVPSCSKEADSDDSLQPVPLKSIYSVPKPVSRNSKTSDRSSFKKVSNSTDTSLLTASKCVPKLPSTALLLSKILAPSEPECSTFEISDSDPEDTEVIKMSYGAEMRETHVCVTCKQEMQGKEAYFCCVCKNSLHLYCGARRQGVNDYVESICYVCLNV